LSAQNLRNQVDQYVLPEDFISLGASSAGDTSAKQEKENIETLAL